MAYQGSSCSNTKIELFNEGVVTKLEGIEMSGVRGNDDLRAKFAAKRGREETYPIYTHLDPDGNRVLQVNGVEDWAEYDREYLAKKARKL